MEAGAATHYRPRPRYYRYGYDIDTLFWGALIFLALFVSCLLAWKAIERLRNRRKFDDGAAVAGGRTRDTKARRDTTPEIGLDPNDRVFNRVLQEQWRLHDHPDMAGMNQHESEEYLLAFGPRKVRKAIKKARQDAQKKHQASHRL
jgi:hypothetical protein